MKTRKTRRRAGTTRQELAADSIDPPRIYLKTVLPFEGYQENCYIGLRATHLSPFSTEQCARISKDTSVTFLNEADWSAIQTLLENFCFLSRLGVEGLSTRDIKQRIESFGSKAKRLLNAISIKDKLDQVAYNSLCPAADSLYPALSEFVRAASEASILFDQNDHAAGEDSHDAVFNLVRDIDHLFKLRGVKATAPKASDAACPKPSYFQRFIIELLATVPKKYLPTDTPLESTAAWMARIAEALRKTRAARRR